MPAFFCGVFGHKPSAGLIPGSGQFPAPDGDAMHLLTSGPLTRRAEDLFPLLRILAGPDGDDPTCTPMTLRDPSEVRLDELTVLVPTRDSFARIDPAMLDTLETVASALEALGLRRESITLPKPAWTFRRWSALMAVGSSERFGAMLRPTRPVGVAELLPWALRRSPHTLPAIVLAALANAPHPRASTLSKIRSEVATLRDQLDDRLAHGVLLYPPYSRPAPRHGGPKLTPFDFTHTALFNVLGLPVTQTPTGIDHLRRPLGVQVVSAHGNDHVTLAVGEALERVFGGSVLSP
jgi:fatty acid amide hydrolase 2